MCQATLIKEFSEEREPINRECLFCETTAPAEIRTEDMTYHNSLRPVRIGESIFPPAYGWYSNALLHPNGEVRRFYLCPNHAHMNQAAWDWAQNGPAWTLRRIK